VKVHNLKEPFHHTIIEDFYEEKELEEILAEMDLREEDFQSDIKDITDPRANDKMSVFYADLYYHHIGDRNQSPLLRYNRKMFDLREELKGNIFAEYLPLINYDNTQVNRYDDGGKYDPHHDFALLTAVTLLWKEPKTFEGGDLEFVDFDYKPELKNNTTILFPSFLQHRVTSCVGNGRYSVNQLYHINPSI